MIVVHAIGLTSIIIQYELRTDTAQILLHLREVPAECRQWIRRKNVPLQFGIEPIDCADHGSEAIASELEQKRSCQFRKAFPDDLRDSRSLSSASPS
jgi:hypothetical protein